MPIIIHIHTGCYSHVVTLTIFMVEGVSSWRTGAGKSWKLVWNCISRSSSSRMSENVKVAVRVRPFVSSCIQFVNECFKNLYGYLYSAIITIKSY